MNKKIETVKRTYRRARGIVCSSYIITPTETLE